MHSKSLNEIDGKIIEQVVNKKSFLEMIKEIILDIKPFLAPDFQPPSTIEGQITDEGAVAEIHDLMMQEDSISFCFKVFQFIKQSLRNVSKEKDEQPIGCYTVSIDTLQQCPQVFHDPFAHVLYSVCCKNSSPLVYHVTKENVDNHLFQSSPSLSCLTDCSFLSPYQSLQSHEEIDKGGFC